jgi:hypothetical protein
MKPHLIAAESLAIFAGEIKEFRVSPLIPPSPVA